MLKGLVCGALLAVSVVPALAGSPNDDGRDAVATGYYKRDGTYVPAQWRAKYLNEAEASGIDAPRSPDHILPQEVELSPREVQAVDEWSFRNNIGSRAEALRRLILRGLKAE